MLIGGVVNGPIAVALSPDAKDIWLPRRKPGSPGWDWGTQDFLAATPF
jgi:hypothetical protein